MLRTSQILSDTSSHIRFTSMHPSQILCDMSTSCLSADFSPFFPLCTTKVHVGLVMFWTRKQLAWMSML